MLEYSGEMPFIARPMSAEKPLHPLAALLQKRIAIIDGATQLARDVGALAQLPIDLQARATAAVWCGDFLAADTLIAEASLVAEATGTLMAPMASMSLAALRGRESEAVPADRGRLRGSHGWGPGTRRDMDALGDRDLV